MVANYLVQSLAEFGPSLSCGEVVIARRRAGNDSGGEKQYAANQSNGLEQVRTTSLSVWLRICKGLGSQINLMLMNQNRMQIGSMRGRFTITLRFWDVQLTPAKFGNGVRTTLVGRTPDYMG